MPHGTLALAASIAEMSLSELHKLLSRRQVLSPRSVRDPLSLAVELLRTESVTTALERLNRAELTMLAHFDHRRGRGTSAAHRSAPDSRPSPSDATVKSLRALGLVGLDTKLAAPIALPEVGAVLEGFRSRGFDVPTAGEAIDSHVKGGDGVTLDAPPAPSDVQRTPGVRDLKPDGQVSDTWYGPALASVNRTAAILRTLAQRPARLSKKGAITVTARRELAEATHDDPEHTARMLVVLESASLTNTRSGHTASPLLWPSPEASTWLSLPVTERWILLARAHVSAIPSELRWVIDRNDIGQNGGGDDAPAPRIYDARRPINLGELVRTALDREFPLLPDAAREEISGWIDAAELIGLTVHGQPSNPMLHLLAADEDAARTAALQDFPETSSGVYLQPDLSVIVPGPLAPSDEQALTTIATTEQIGVAVTMRLSTHSLTRALRSGIQVAAIRALLERISLTGVPQPLEYLLGDLERKHLEGALTDAAGVRPDARRANFAATTVSTAPEHTLAPIRESTNTAEPRDEISSVAKLVHAAAQQHASAGDLTRQLEFAIRKRSPVRVTAVGGREERTFTLLPVSLTSGRLRATDQAAGVERTLPLSAITAVDLASMSPESLP